MHHPLLIRVRPSPINIHSSSLPSVEPSPTLNIGNSEIFAIFVMNILEHSQLFALDVDMVFDNPVIPSLRSLTIHSPSLSQLNFQPQQDQQHSLATTVD